MTGLITSIRAENRHVRTLRRSATAPGEGADAAGSDHAVTISITLDELVASSDAPALLSRSSLLQNAVEAAGPGGKVSVAVEERAQEIRETVTDSGRPRSR